MKKTVSMKKIRESLTDRIKKIKPEDVPTVLKEEPVIIGTVESKGPLKKFIYDVKTMLSMIKDYSTGKYKKVPFWSIAAIVAALLYVINPIDLIPELIIPVVGFIDDAAIITLCLSMVKEDLIAYKKWKNTQPSAI